MAKGDLGAAQSALSRRKLLELTACAGMASALSACSNARPAQTIEASVTTIASAETSPLAPAPLATPAPLPPSMLPVISQPLLCRDAWGAAPIRPGGIEKTPNRMTLHHSAVNFDDNRTITARLRQHQHYHQDDHGWIDIAYHVAVDRKGNLFALRPTNLVGNTATDYDPAGHFLVLVEGNFDEQAVTEDQLNGAAVAFAWAAQKWGITSNTLMGHRDVPAATSCPGTNLEAHISSGDLKRRVDDLLVGGPVELREVCGSEAEAIVANIEAGR